MINILESVVSRADFKIASGVYARGMISRGAMSGESVRRSAMSRASTSSRVIMCIWFFRSL